MNQTLSIDQALDQVRTSNKQYFKMGEVGDLTELEPHVLRFWEGEFTSLKPRKNRSGHRIFSKADVELVLRIKSLLYDQGFTIAGAKRRLNEGGDSTAKPNLNGANQQHLVKAIREIETILLDTLKVLDAP